MDLIGHCRRKVDTVAVSNTPDFFDPDQVGSKSGVSRLKFWALVSKDLRDPFQDLRNLFSVQKI